MTQSRTGASQIVPLMENHSFSRLLFAIGSGLRCRGEKHDPVPDLLTSSAYIGYLSGFYRASRTWMSDSACWQQLQLLAQRGSGCGCNGADVLGVDEAPHLATGRMAVDQVAAVAEAAQVEGPDVHHRLKPLDLFVGQLDVPAIRAHGQFDPVAVAPRAPHQSREVGQARAASRCLPVDRH